MPRLLTWYFDVISPYAYLQTGDLHRLPADTEITPKPVLFAGLLNHWGQKGPAEIPAKRLHTYRQCAWMAAERGLPFRMPPAHPFNPLTALRLLCALGPTVDQARIATRVVFGEGHDPSTPDGLAALGKALGVDDPAALAADDAAKARLRANTDEAVAKTVWGVPTFEAEGELFWGADSFPMLLDFLGNPGLFEDGEMRRHGELPMGAVRKA
ncbi:MAG TPA: DsbA family protein [Alphaproteobacteria bacterium]|jgi:2-hydroxychromene-2-carboxylate isomerase|nr:DsbA family protein [Alphaproteobacteria bacterium]